MKKIKAVFFDIDGTLQPLILDGPECHVSIDTYEALHQLRNKGIKVFIATGRPLVHVERFINNLDFQLDGMIINNGQYVTYNNEVIHSVTIDNNEFRQVLDYLEKYQIGTFIVEENKMFKNLDLEELNFEQTPLYDINRLNNHPVYQMMTHIHSDQKDIQKEFYSILSSCKGARWNDLSIDVFPKSGGKDKGIEAVLKHLNIDKENIMAFGDGDNDIDMLKYAGIGVAMGNANQRVKDASDYITSDVSDKGIYNALKHFKVI